MKKPRRARYGIAITRASCYNNINMRVFRLRYNKVKSSECKYGSRKAANRRERAHCMTREALLLFMKRILERGSEQKSSASLRQLKEILMLQNADPSMVELVEKTLASLPEAKAEAAGPALTEEDLRVAIRRAEERRQRELAMADRGSC